MLFPLLRAAAVVLLCTVACACGPASRPSPASSAPTPPGSPPDPAAPRHAAAPHDPAAPAGPSSLVLTRAGQLLSAASHARSKSGTCPTPSELREHYALDPSVFLDDAQRELRIECTDLETRITSGDQVLASLAWNGSPSQPTAPDGPAGTPGAAPRDLMSSSQKDLAALRPRFRRCYVRELQSNPSASGALKGSIEVLEDGTAGKVAMEKPATMSQALVDCVSSVLKAHRFEATGTMRTIRIGD